MNRITIVAISALIVLGAISASSATVIFADQDRINKLQGQIDKLLDRIEVLHGKENKENYHDIQERIAGIQEKIDAKQAIIDRLTVEMSGTATSTLTAAEQAIQIQNNINILVDQVNDQVAQITELQNQLAQLVSIQAESSAIEIPEQDIDVNMLESYVMVNNTSPRLGDVVLITGQMFVSPQSYTMQYANGTEVESSLSVANFHMVVNEQDCYAVHRNDHHYEHNHDGMTHTHYDDPSDFNGKWHDEQHGNLDCTFDFDDHSFSGTFVVESDWIVQSYRVGVSYWEQYEFGNGDYAGDDGSDAVTSLAVWPPL